MDEFGDNLGFLENFLRKKNHKEMEKKSKEIGNIFVLFGTLPLAPSIYKHFETRLGKFVLWIHDYILGSFGLKGFAPVKTHSILMSREAALKIVPNINEHDFHYENEIVLLAGMFRIPIDAVDETHIPLLQQKQFSIISFIYTTHRLAIMFIEYSCYLRKRLIVTP